jgi:hypothetical protein
VDASAARDNFGGKLGMNARRDFKAIYAIKILPQ